MHTGLNSEQVRALAEKFWNGQSSLEEEAVLRNYFAGGNSADGLEDLALYFTTITAEQHRSLGKDFDDAVRAATVSKPVQRVQAWPWWLGGVAAALVLALLIFRPGGETKQVQVAVKTPLSTASPEVRAAYEETRSALLLISDKLNKGQQQTLLLGKFSEAEARVRKTTEQ